METETGAQGTPKQLEFVGRVQRESSRYLNRDHLESLVDGSEDMWLTLRTAKEKNQHKLMRNQNSKGSHQPESRSLVITEASGKSPQKSITLVIGLNQH